MSRLGNYQRSPLGRSDQGSQGAHTVSSGMLYAEICSARMPVGHLIMDALACSWLEPRQGTLVDDSGEQLGMLRGGEMATGKHANVEASGTQPRA